MARGLTTLDRHGASHGYGWAGAAIERGKVQNPTLRQQVMALRYDPDASALVLDGFFVLNIALSVAILMAAISRSGCSCS